MTLTEARTQIEETAARLKLLKKLARKLEAAETISKEIC